MSARLAGLLLSLFVAVVIGFLSIAPLATPGPGPIAADTFSVERALAHVVAVAGEPRPIGSPAGARVRSYLVEELTALGLQPRLQSVTVPDYYSVSGGEVDVVNVMARIPGTGPTKAVALVGHYDTVPWTPGANDDASAVATLLETARALLAGPDLRNDVILLFTDGEEPAPRYGSTAFVTGHPWAGDVGLAINFEALGGSGPSLLIETGGPDEWLIEAVADAVPEPAAFSFLTDLTELIGGSDTDFSPFAGIGVPGLNFAYLRDSAIYHTPDDVIERLDPGSLGQHGARALSLARHFGDMDLSVQPPGGDAVFFTVGSLLVHYPAGWVLPSALLLALFFGLLVLSMVNRSEATLRGVLTGAGIEGVGILAAALVATGTWRLLTRIRPTPGIVESYGYLVVLVAISGAVWFAVRRIGARNRTGVDQGVGVVLLWVVLALLTAMTMPGAGYLFVWPALLTCLVLAWWPASTRWWDGPVRIIAVAGPSLILLVPAVDVFYQLAQPRPGNPDSEIVDVIAIVIILALLVVALIDSALGSPLAPQRRYVESDLNAAVQAPEI